MVWIKRISLFILVNLLVMFTINILLNVLGVRPYINAYGIDYGQLMAFCLVWGFGGAFISLLLSKTMAKWGMGVQIIDSSVSDPELRFVVATVERLAKNVGITRMPEVGVFESAMPNAFATGPTKNNALVAVSTGLLRNMDRSQVEGVIGHEIAHVANGDMVTLTLIQGVVNAFVMFLSRAIAFGMSSRDDRERGMSPWVVRILLELVLGLFGAMVVAAFSRWREFRADAGGAQLAGTTKMISALQALQRVYEPDSLGEAPATVAALRISGRSGGFLSLFSTHPPLEERIARLKSTGFSRI